MTSSKPYEMSWLALKQLAKGLQEIKKTCAFSWWTMDTLKINLQVQIHMCFLWQQLLERKRHFKIKARQLDFFRQQVSQVSINRGKLTSLKSRTYNTKQSSLKCKHHLQSSSQTNKLLLSHYILDHNHFEFIL